MKGDQAQSFQYDTLGNMTFNSKVGTYTYPPPGPTGCTTTNGAFAACRSPHAVGTAGTDTIKYDKNGQLSLISDAAGKPTRSSDWTFDHKPSVVTDAAGIATTYG